MAMVEVEKSQFIRGIDNGSLYVRKQTLMHTLANGTLPEGFTVDMLREELIILEQEIAFREQQPALTFVVEKPLKSKSSELNYKQIVIDRLEQCRLAMRSQAILAKEIEWLVNTMTPGEQSLTPSYSGMSGSGGSNHSKVEQAVMKPYEDLIEMRQLYHEKKQIVAKMDLALGQLNKLHFEILTQCYMTDDYVKDEMVYRALNISRSGFYKHRREAIETLAKVLKII